LCYNERMRNAKQTLDEQFLEMRWRCLSLAADLDRVQNAPGGQELINSDVRMSQLKSALTLLGESQANRAEKVQLLFSDPIQ
jgi:hypothetical protein